MFRRIAPQHMLQEEQIFLLNFLFSFQERMGLEQGEGLAVAPVGGLKVSRVEAAANIGDAPIDVRGNREGASSLLQLVQFRQGEDCALGLRLGFEHAQKAKIFGNVVDHEAEQKPVVKRGQLLFFRQLIAGAEESQQRHASDLLAVVKQALINQGQNCVQNGRVRFKNLIEKGNMRIGQYAAGDPAIVVLLQRF